MSHSSHWMPKLHTHSEEWHDNMRCTCLSNINCLFKRLLRIYWHRVIFIHEIQLPTPLHRSTVRNTYMVTHQMSLLTGNG